MGGDVPVPPEPEPTELQKLARFVPPIEGQVRHALTGSHVGRVRRTILFLIVGVGVVTAQPVIALPALLVLALNDQVVDV